MKTVTIYTDGSCSGKTHKGGFAGLMECKSHKLVVVGSKENSTNNEMELVAPVKCLQLLQEPCKVQVVSDSQYVVNGINKWLKNWESNDWKTSKGTDVTNKSILQELSSLMKTHKVKAKWVRGHNGHFENEIADKLAQECSK